MKKRTFFKKRAPSLDKNDEKAVDKPAAKPTVAAKKSKTCYLLFSPNKLARLQKYRKLRQQRLLIEQLSGQSVATDNDAATQEQDHEKPRGIKRLLNRFSGQQSSKKRKDMCGVVIFDNGIALAHVTWNKQGQPELVNCLYRKAADSNEIKNVLMGLVDRYRLRTCQFSWVLLSPRYQLLQIPTPEAPPDQLKFVARQEVKDFLNIPFEQAAIEVFHMPPHGASGFQRKVFVVASSLFYLQDHRMVYVQNQLDLSYIDINELALRNIANLLITPEEPGFAILHCQQEATFLYIGVGVDLFLSHRIEINMDRIVQADDSDLQSLVKELKRASDYYTSQIGKELPPHLWLVPCMGDNESLMQKMNDLLEQEVALINLNDLLDCSEEWPVELQAHCMSAVGGALRQHE